MQRKHYILIAIITLVFVALTAILKYNDIQSKDRYEVIYITSPVSSWAYGCHAEIERIKQDCEENPKYDFSVQIGKLTEISPLKLDSVQKQKLKEIWSSVNKTFEVELDTSLLEGNVSISSFWADKAMNIILNYNSENMMSYLSDIQKMFFQEGVSKYNAQDLAIVAEKYGFERDEFETQLHSKNCIQATLFSYDASSEIQPNPIYPTIAIKYFGKTDILVEGSNVTYEAYQKALSKYLKEKELAIQK